jgi:hypothetical protein
MYAWRALFWACCGCGAQHLTKRHWPRCDGSASAPACVRRSQRVGHVTLACCVMGVLWLWSPALSEEALALPWACRCAVSTDTRHAYWPCYSSTWFPLAGM